MTRFYTTWLEHAGKLSPWAAVVIGTALLLATGFLDWTTGPQVAVTVVYVVPITWMAWWGGRWLGLGMALACGGVWLCAELLGAVNYVSPLVPYWNALVRTTMFCLVAGLESEVMERKRVERGLRRAKEGLEGRVQERTAQLQAVNQTLEQRVAERSAAAEERALQLARSEGALQKQTEILQSILDSMGDGVVVADSAGRLILMNPAAKRILRMPSAETNAVGWLESQESFRPDGPAGAGGANNPLLGAVRGEAVDGAEMFLRHENHPKGIWLTVTGRPLVDQAGRNTGGVIVFSDISARKDLERQIADVSDREQRRIGEDLHDGLCQHLVSTALAARTLASKLADKALPEREDAAQIAELVGESISQARHVARGLYLVPLEAGGLQSALEELAVQVRSRHRIACQFAGRVSVQLIEETLVTGLFRIAQEAVNNAIKHAQPGLITLSLAADQEHIRLSIEDDGAGFQAGSDTTAGMGLHLMNYRARMIGATLHIGPRPAGGTVVSCSVHRSIEAQPADIHAGQR